MPLLGIDIGGTKTAVVAATADGSILLRREFATRPERGVEAFLDDVEPVVRAFQREVGGIACASVSVGGPLDDDTGVLHDPPHLPTWKGAALGRMIAERLALPTYLMHDAKAGAYAEWRFGSGAADPQRTLGFITFATGFGLGVAYGGRVLRMPGEIGHWRVAEDGPELFGKRGGLEGLASGAGIAMQAQAAEFPAGTTAEQLADLARNGDARAKAIFEDVAVQVGRQCARLIDLFGLRVVALGTIAVRAGDLLMERIGEAAREEALPHLIDDCEILPARLGEHLGDVASLSAALDAGWSEPDGKAPRAVNQMAVLCNLADRVHCDAALMKSIDKAAAAIVEALEGGKKVLTCGNGGSATDAAHLAEELVGRYRGNRPSLPAISLAADGSVLTCIANDFGYDEVFARQVEGLGAPGDVLVAFTTSGKSENINRALRRAREAGMRTIALTGKEGGDARQLADIAIHVPHHASERIQEIHTFVLHCMCEAVERRFG